MLSPKGLSNKKPPLLSEAESGGSMSLSFDLDRRQAFCQYCGSTLLIDDENTVNIDAVTWMEQGSRRADG